MTCDAEWKKFIQVNIYGRTLQELSRQGIVLETVLNDIGCPNVWIVEGSMYNSIMETPPTSEDDESDDVITEPLLSTTIANVKLPRFSTPIAPLIDLDRKFTLNLPRKFSTIDPDFEVEFIDTDDSVEHQDEPSEDVEGILDDILEKVVDDVEKKPILSTTIAQIPRYSTPISASHVDFDIPEGISDIDSDEGEEVIKEEKENEKEGEGEEEEEDEKEPEEESRPSLKRKCTEKYPEDVVEVQEAPLQIKKEVITRRHSTAPALKRRRSRRLSAPQHLLKTEEPPERKPIVAADFSYGMDYQDYGDDFFSVASNVDYEENGIEQEVDEMPNIERAQDGILNSEDVEIPPILKREISSNTGEEEATLEYNRGNHSMDLGNDDVNHFSAPEEEDETAIMVIDEDKIHTPPPLSLISTKSILKGKGDDDGEDKAKKTVSFGVPKNKMTAKQKRLDEIHQIHCCYEGCDKVLSWKIRYGKQRLLDHAMSHIEDKCLSCRTCDADFSTSRQIRYHYKRVHPEVKCDNFNIQEVFQLEIVNDSAVGDLFDYCFGKFSSIVGKIGKLRNMRTKRQKKQNNKKEKENVEEEEEVEEGEEENGEEDEDVDKDTPGPSSGSLFYFRRIF